MLKSFNYRIYPNKQQRILIEKHFGCSRFIYNWALDLRIKIYQTDKKYISDYDLMKQLPNLKEQLPWLKEDDNVYKNNEFEVIIHGECDRCFKSGKLKQILVQES